MATQQWTGDATAVAQVATNTVANTWAASDTLTTTLTLEDGVTTQAVVSTATGSIIETDVRDVHLADLQASTLSEFVKITWAASSTDAITGTAKTAGVPFYLAATESTAGSGTFTEVETTANSGSNDWNTAANWTTAVPGDGDTVYLNTGSSSVLYGLNQSTISLAKMVITKNFTGQVGDLSTGYYLRIDVNFNSGTLDEDYLVIGSSGLTTMIDGDLDIVKITAVAGGLDMVKLKGSTTSSSIYVADGCRGTINVAANHLVSRLVVSDSPTAIVKIGQSSAVRLGINSGTVELTDRSLSGLSLMGGNVVMKGTSANAASSEYEAGAGTHVFGGTLDIQSDSGTFGRIDVFGGIVTFNSSAIKTTLTVSKAYVYGGKLEDRSELGAVTWTDGIRKFGGIVDVPGTTVTQI